VGEDLVVTTASARVTEAAPASVRTVTVPPALVAVTAVAAAAAALIKFDLSGRSFVAALFSAVLVVLSAVDLERRIIPNRIVVPAAVAVLVGDIAAEPHRAREWSIATATCLLGALVLSVLSRGGVGMGDVKLASLLGAGLGWNVLGGLLVTAIATFFVGAAILLQRGLAARKETIPFGPLLALGALVELFIS
jgi:leader peptidase (prepilin peptidase) / N-methyltransferase